MEVRCLVKSSRVEEYGSGIIVICLISGDGDGDGSKKYRCSRLKSSEVEIELVREMLTFQRFVVVVVADPCRSRPEFVCHQT